MFRLIWRILLAVSLLPAGPALAQGKGPLVLAAASLQESLTAAADAWTAKGHARPVISFAASPALARQVEAGARADLFISADEGWMDYLAKKGLIMPASRADLLTNRIVLIAPAGKGARLTIGKAMPIGQTLGENGRLAMADPDTVPAGKYGKAALEALGVWSSVSNRIARGENVRAALALVERGEAPLGIVYATDARASARVRVVGTFPASSHPPIRYPIARLKTATNKETDAFRRFLLSPEGRAIFLRFGFSAR
jgi:molybdate transport system substrate-binding protein